MRPSDLLPPELWLEHVLRRIACIRDGLPPPEPPPLPESPDADEAPAEPDELAEAIREFADRELERRGIVMSRNSSIAERFAVALYGQGGTDASPDEAS